LETSQQEQAELKYWVEEHERLTGSLLARELLGKWQEGLARFWLIQPRPPQLLVKPARAAERVTKG
ncbi:MAG: hypothetical protein U0931_40855, partial [Vulcanimicrobiota bacterium]